MTARVSTDGAHGGLQALVLENELLRAVVLPELGGKLWQLTGLRTGQGVVGVSRCRGGGALAGRRGRVSRSLVPKS